MSKNAWESKSCSSKNLNLNFRMLRWRARVAWNLQSTRQSKEDDFANIVSKPSPNSGYKYKRSGRKHLSLQKVVRNLEKWNFAIKILSLTFHSMASSIKNERNLLPYWSGSAVLKVKYFAYYPDQEMGMKEIMQGQNSNHLQQTKSSHFPLKNREVNPIWCGGQET